MAAAAVVVAVGITGLTSTLPATAAEDPDVLKVDFATTTGAFRGGASGTLYGFGDEGAPTQALIDGAHITNSSQKPPFGTQHPSGDILKIEDGFFAKHGQELAIYIQDHYPDWPYHRGTRVGDVRTYDQTTGTYTDEPNGVWDYLEVVELMVEAVATQSDHPEKYLFIPFNEPDGIWYQNWSTMRDTFLADWKAVHDKIQEVYARHGLPTARIGGPGDARWHLDRSQDFLTYAKQHDVLPDVFIWHELGINNLATYRSHLAAYRGLERELGVNPIHVNITEYGMLRDMGVPGQLIQWFSMFEDTKVDSQTAYWNYAGNFSDNSARPGGANGGWWLFKSYGDLAGSQTVKVTPPHPDTVDTLQGIGALDAENRRAMVLFGGTDKDVRLELTGLAPSISDRTVDVEVREITLTGAQGLQHTPPVVLAIDGAKVKDGALTLDVPTYDRYAAYQVIVTPSQNREVTPTDVWSTAIEAEETVLTGAQTYTQDPTSNGGWKFLASHGRDVGSFNKVDSRADWTVTVPRDGTYRFQVIGGTPGVPGRHALFVDGALGQTVQYTADLALTATHRWQYRGSAEVTVDLTAGEHVLSLRASADGTTLLPNADITLDKFVLTDVTDGEPTVYPASTMRLVGGATLGWTDPSSRGFARMAGDGQRAELYANAMESGYHDVAVHHRTGAASDLTLAINGRDVTTFTTPSEGGWVSTARVHLAEGINEVELQSAGGSAVGDVTVTRTPQADEAATTIEAEDAELHGTAVVATKAASTGTNASGGAVVEWLGNGEQNYLQIPRGQGFDRPGVYDVVVRYSNAELSGRHDYNPQVVDRELQIREGDHQVPVGRTHFRYTFAWNSFWERTVPVTLTTGDAPLRLGNTAAFAPNIDSVTVAPLLAAEPVTVAVDD